MKNKLKVLAIVLVSLAIISIGKYVLMFIGLILYTTDDNKKTNYEIIRYMDKKYDVKLRLIKKEIIDDDTELYVYRRRKDKDFIVEVEQYRTDTGPWDIRYEAELVAPEKIGKLRKGIKKVLGESFDVSVGHGIISVRGDYEYDEITKVAERLLRFPSYIKKNKWIFTMSDDIDIGFERDNFYSFNIGQFDDELECNDLYMDEYIFESSDLKISDEDVMVELLKYRYMRAQSDGFKNMQNLEELPSEDVQYILKKFKKITPEN